MVDCKKVRFYRDIGIIQEGKIGYRQWKVRLDRGIGRQQECRITQRQWETS